MTLPLRPGGIATFQSHGSKTQWGGGRDTGATCAVQFARENKNATPARNFPIMINQLRAALEAVHKDTGLIIECNANTVWNNINSICKKNGFPNVGIHGLRHSFVSLAYHLGVQEKIVMEIGGWADYQTMRRIYAHIARSDTARYTEQFSGFYPQDKEGT